MKRTTKIIFIIGIVIVLALICLLMPKDESIPVAGKVFIFSKIENVEVPEFAAGAEIVEHTAYTLQYNEVHEQADWVSYILTRTQIENKVERKDRFKKDPLVTSGSAEPKDYSRSGYDRGHLAPAADLSSTEETMLESFYMSNMSPQKPGFNRGVWKRLEEQVRDWGIEFDTLYVVTGPVLEEGLETIGENDVSVPNKYYKALLVYKPERQIAIGFILKNESSSENLETFAVTVDSLETLLNFNFFEKLPDGLENEIESILKTDDWFLTN